MLSWVNDDIICPHCKETSIIDYDINYDEDITTVLLLRADWYEKAKG